MKANELRIGNWVLNQGEPIELTKQKFKMAVISFNCQEIKPIPLTEEWLVRFGFKKRKCGNYIWWIHARIQFTDKMELLIDGNLWIEIESVHQLQNLYFALTGEELKTKQD